MQRFAAYSSSSSECALLAGRCAMTEEQHISVQSEEEQGDGGEETQRTAEKQATGRNVAEDVEASNGRVASEGRPCVVLL